MPHAGSNKKVSFDKGFERILCGFRNGLRWDDPSVRLDRKRLHVFLRHGTCIQRLAPTKKGGDRINGRRLGLCNARRCYTSDASSVIDAFSTFDTGQFSLAPFASS